VLNADVEAALFEHVKVNPESSVDDMLWWLYDTYKIVVGTRTIRRVFERKGDKVKGGKGRATARRLDGEDEEDDDEDEDEDGQTPPTQPDGEQYQSPYAPVATAQIAEQQLARAFAQQQTPQPSQYPTLVGMDPDLPDDEETIQLQLQQIELQKREVELKLKMRRLRQGKGTPASSAKSNASSTPQSTAASTLFNPQAALGPTPPKRDSRSKKKIEESKRRTAERQERMLKELERRSRRRDHLTAEWVQSKDIWPLRAQGLLADLMHQYGCYAFTPTGVDTFEAMYRDLYQLVDLNKGDWLPPIHDEMLRERMKRKMGQLRAKMQKTGEIVGRGDAYGGWQKADDYTGEAAGAAIGDESELNVAADGMQSQAGAQQMMDEDHQQHQQPMQYEPVPDHQQALQQHDHMPYGAAPPMMQQQQQQQQGGPHHAPSTPQYPMMPQQHHDSNLLPYNLGGQPGMGGHQESMVI